MSISKHNPNIYFIEGGSLLRSLIGPPLLILGLLVVALPLLKTDTDPLPLSLLGVCLLLAGFLFCFYRCGLQIDRDTDSLIKWWGLLKPLKRETHRLSDFDRVVSSREVRRVQTKSGWKSHYVFSIYLDGKSRLGLEDHWDMMKIRQASEDLARFFGLPHQNTAVGMSKLRMLEYLDESLRDRVRRLGEEVMVPTVPEKLRSAVRFKPGDLHIRIPTSRVSWGWALSPLIVLAIVIWRFYPAIGNVLEHLSNFEFLSLMSIAILAGVLSISFACIWAAKTLTSEDVRVTREEVVLTKGWIFHRTWLMPSDVIEELQVVSSTVDDRSAVTLQSDETMLYFGKHLPRPEKEYLAALVRKVLTE